MEEKEGMSGSSSKKVRAEIDFDKCLEDSTDEPPLEVTIVRKGSFSGDDQSSLGTREQPPCPEGMEKIRRLSEKDLEDAIRRITAQVSGGICTRLPDKGEKFKASLKLHLEERERRRLQSRTQGASERTGFADMERSRPRGAPDEAKKEAPSRQAPPSEFASRLTAKLESGSASCNWGLKKEHAVCDALDKDPMTSGRGDRTKRKRKKARLTLKEKQENGLSWEAEEKPRFVSIQTFFCDQSDPAEKNQRHEKKDDCRGLRSCRSNSEKTVVLLDEEEPDVEDTTATVEVGLRDTTIYYPSSEDPECVEIQFKDLNCLAPGEYLSSTIMNFYIRFLQGPSFAANNGPNDYHFFNTYFYKKLQEAVSNQRIDKESSFVKFRRWWRGVNIFQKAYIFLPVHEDLHWSLAIVCIPDKADESGPIILHLDSLRYHSSKSIFQNIRRFLKEEWDFLRGESDPPDVSMTNRIWNNLPRRIEEQIITVPQQNNDFDCGLFVLYFMDRFIEDAPQRLKKQDLRMFGRRWFKPAEASNLRGEIKRRLVEEFQKLKNTTEIVPMNLPSDGDSVEKA